MTSQIEQQPSNLQGGQRNASRNDGHLPECFMAARLGVDTYAPDVLTQMKRAGCICDRLRACEERVRQEIDRKAFALDEGDPYREAYRAGLGAARDAVDRLASDMANWSSAETAAAASAAPDLTADQWTWAQRGVHRSLAAIDALREQQPQPLPSSVGFPTTPMWPAR